MRETRNSAKLKGSKSQQDIPEKRNRYGNSMSDYYSVKTRNLNVGNFSDDSKRNTREKSIIDIDSSSAEENENNSTCTISSDEYSPDSKVEAAPIIMNEVTSEFDKCNHGDLIHDYVCFECSFSRWLVSWNSGQPQEKRKERPEKVSKEINLGHLKNVSIKLNTTKSVPGIDITNSQKTKEGAATFGVSSGGNLSQGRSGLGKSDFSEINLPSGISINKVKPAEMKWSSISVKKTSENISMDNTNGGETSNSKEKVNVTENTVPNNTSSNFTKEATINPRDVLTRVDWAKVFQFTGLTHKHLSNDQ